VHCLWCIQGAQSVINFELMPRPPTERSADNPWPTWPTVFRVDYGHAEVQLKFGRDPRIYNVMSKVCCSNGRQECDALSSDSVTCRVTQGNMPLRNPSYICWYLIYLSQKDERLS